MIKLLPMTVNPGKLPSFITSQSFSRRISDQSLALIHRISISILKLVYPAILNVDRRSVTARRSKTSLKSQRSLKTQRKQSLWGRSLWDPNLWKQRRLLLKNQVDYR